MVWGMGIIQKFQSGRARAEAKMADALPRRRSVYLRVPLLGAFYIECSTLYSMKPIFQINSWNNEIILDFPGGQAIITPWSKLRREETSA